MTITVAVDSFAGLDEANEYFAARLHAATWTEADDAMRERALKTATATLCRESYSGRITSQVQPLAWPRTGATDAEGRRIDANAIPRAIVHATAELALSLLRDDLTDDANRRHVFAVVRQRVGESETEYASAPVHDLPGTVRALIRPLLRVGGSSAAIVP
ncbi:hypothetical protein ABIE65_001883 [Constrictibacter sp. MBR-5]|jgi:hypothetical protein|uniref:DnaT-like ssDNA-binding protein n=1 Tax=Constrictibacter sp. MBR-5 TaxID=3156467 RepID=UPI003392032D